MNEWFKKILDQVKTLWSKWTVVQRIVLLGIVGAVVLGIILLFSFSASPSMVPILSKSIKDPKELERITNRLETEGISYSVTADDKIMARDDKSAKRAKAILARENLIPAGTDPWEIFDVERWTLTDFERDVNLRRAITAQIEQHITALEDVDSASVNIVMPKKELLAADQDPTTASVIISPKPGSDIASNRKKLEGLQRLIQYGIPGLKAENITISDKTGIRLNDFAEMADFDNLELKKRILKVKKEYEAQLNKQIRQALSQIYTEDRIVIPNIDIGLDPGNKSINKTEYTPIIMKPRTPGLPYDDSVVVPNLERSRSDFKEDYKGTGFNPEGPPGVQGQTPPAYKDLQEGVGTYTRTDSKVNYEVNETKTQEQGSPEIKRFSVSVAIDGIWKRAYKPDGSMDFNTDGSIKREYVSLTPEEIKSAEELIKGSVGYNAARGDIVTVQNIKFDRTKEQAKEDEEIRKAQQTQMVVLYSLIGVAVILAVFIIFRLVSREIERRRRLREEELARQHQAMREAALRSAEEESTEVEMSVEDRARLELQEHAVNVAREHPEEVAQLIRTWLTEE